MSTYRPLPKSLTISESPIDGLGLFAVEDIPKGTDLGVIRYKLGEEDWIRTPLGGFINHSGDPNCSIILDYIDMSIGTPLRIGDSLISTTEMDQILLLTVKDIKAGEELTLKYTLYKV